jgi:hypothetical protein
MSQDVLRSLVRREVGTMAFVLAGLFLVLVL